MSDDFGDLRQPLASSGVRIPMPAELAEVLDVIEPCEHWELRWISQVWSPGDRSVWGDRSWGSSPYVLDDARLRSEGRDAEQVINGRFVGTQDDTEVVMVESVDSTFWLVWSDDERLITRIVEWFPRATSVRPPTEFHPHG